MQGQERGEGSSRRQSSLPSSLRQHLVSAPPSPTSRSASFESHQFETVSQGGEPRDRESSLTNLAIHTTSSSSAAPFASSLQLAPADFEDTNVRSTSQDTSESSSSGDSQAENTRRFVQSSSPSFNTHIRSNPIPSLHDYAYNFTSPSPYTYPPPAPPSFDWLRSFHWSESERGTSGYYPPAEIWGARDPRTSSQFPVAGSSRAAGYPGFSGRYSPTSDRAGAAASSAAAAQIPSQPPAFLSRNSASIHQPFYPEDLDQRPYSMSLPRLLGKIFDRDIFTFLKGFMDHHCLLPKAAAPGHQLENPCRLYQFWVLMALSWSLRSIVNPLHCLQSGQSWRALRGITGQDSSVTLYLMDWCPGPLRRGPTEVVVGRES